MTQEERKEMRPSYKFRSAQLRTTLQKRLLVWVNATLFDAKNLSKGSWREASLDELLDKLREEYAEILQAIVDDKDPWPEVGDLAAAAAMVADAVEARRLEGAR